MSSPTKKIFLSASFKVCALTLGRTGKPVCILKTTKIKAEISYSGVVKQTLYHNAMGGGSCV